MIRVYTDGSCWPNDGTGDGGWSFVAYQNGVEMFSRSGGASKTTNNQMELTGMLEALRWVGPRHAVVMSDSRYVVCGLNDWCKGWERRGWMRKDKLFKELQPVANVELWKAAYAARLACHQVEWVKGHAGIIGNERADKLAEAARVKQGMSEETYNTFAAISDPANAHLFTAESALEAFAHIKPKDLAP